MGGALIVDSPAPVDKSQPFTLDQTPDNGVDGVVLFPPPPIEEIHFNLDEFSIWVCPERRHNIIYDTPDLYLVVLVSRVHPSDVIVRVGYQMDVKFVRVCPTAGTVPALGSDCCYCQLKAQNNY